MKLAVKDIKGQSQGELEVKFALIENDKGTQAVHDAVVAYLANQRMGTACTKNVGEVAGTNRKPWRQKGTGRARAGSFRSPLWRGGGVVFGPKPRDFGKKVGRKTRQLALRKAMTERLKMGDVLLVEELKLDGPKTKQFIDVLKRFELKGTALIVAAALEPNLQLATRNLQKVEVTTPDTLNTYQVLRHDKLLFVRSAFERLEERLQD